MFNSLPTLASVECGGAYMWMAIYKTELCPLKIVPCPITNSGQGSLVVPSHVVMVKLCFQ